MSGGSSWSFRVNSPAEGRLRVEGERPIMGILDDLLGVRTLSLTGVRGGVSSTEPDTGDDGAVVRSTEPFFSCARRVRADMDDCCVSVLPARRSSVLNSLALQHHPLSNPVPASMLYFPGVPPFSSPAPYDQSAV